MIEFSVGRYEDIVEAWVGNVKPYILLDLRVVEPSLVEALVKIVYSDLSGEVLSGPGGIVISLWWELEDGVVGVEDYVAAVDGVNDDVTEGVLENRSRKPLVVGDVGE